MGRSEYYSRCVSANDGYDRSGYLLAMYSLLQGTCGNRGCLAPPVNGTYFREENQWADEANLAFDVPPA